MLFVHDFLDSSEKTYQEVALKYNRRIKRLRELLESEKINLVFVARNKDNLVEWGKEYAIGTKTPFTNKFQNWKTELSMVFDAKYPKLNYALCDFSHFSSHFGEPASIRHKIRWLISRIRSMIGYVKRKLF